MGAQSQNDLHSESVGFHLSDLEGIEG